MGFEAGLYMGSLNYSQELQEIKKVADSLENADDIGTDITSWVDPFRNYVYKNFKIGNKLTAFNWGHYCSMDYFRYLQGRAYGWRI